MIKTNRSRGFAAYLLKPWIHVAILVAAGFIVHFPALQGQPIWDDEYLTRTNPLIKSPLFIFEVFRHHLFLDSYSPHYRPVQDLSYMVDYAVWNGNIYGFHLSNVLLHISGAIFLYFLLGQILPPLLTGFQNRNQTVADNSWSQTVLLSAFFAALLWVVHPVHSAAVDYVSGRADSLAFTFACAGWLVFAKARHIPRRLLRYSLFAGAWFLGLLALASRESACLWILLFLVYLFGLDQSIHLRRKFVILLACLTVAGAYGALRSLPEPRPQAQPSNDWPPAVRAVLMGRALGDYGRLMVFPGNLHMERSVFDPQSFHNRESRSRVISLEYLSALGLLIGGALLLGAVKRDHAQRVRIFGAAWFLLCYLPVSNIIDLNATVAEHWLYLPSVGFIIFLVGVALSFPLSWRKAGVALACFAAVALGARSYVRSSDWMSNEVLARNTMAAGGISIRVVLLLGQAHLARRDYAEAEQLFRKALQLCPQYPPARNCLGDALRHQGKEKEAEAVFAVANHDARETRKDYPRTWITILNLAHLHHDQHDDATALDLLQKAQQEYPNTWELISFQSELLRQDTKLDQSIALIRPFAERHWWHFAAALALGRLYGQKGDVNLAQTALEHASRLDIHDTQALNFIATMQLNRNRLPEACAAQRRAVSRQPDEPRQYALLSNILEKMGRTDEARDALAKVSRLRALADNVAVN
jgi:tetratricopeptide (TPR) repeat protein